LLLVPGVASGQPNTQLWAELQLGWIKSHDINFGVEFEPKTLVTKPAGDPYWAALDITQTVEVTRGRWVDLGAQLLLGYTKQNNDLNTSEVTPRVGVRLHLLSNIRDDLFKERVPRRRLVLSNLLRLEWRNLYYSTDEPSSSTTRIRNRFELSYPITRLRITEDGALFAHADVEWFWPQGDPNERFANQQRLRAGAGYRNSRQWRYRALFVWDRSRDSAHEGFTNSYYALELTARRVWW
jgi:hypothetical protein